MNMKLWRVVYVLQPDAENITVEFFARNYEELVELARVYRLEGFSVEEVAR